MKKFFLVFTCVCLLSSFVRGQQIKGDFDRQTDWGVQTSLGGGVDPSFTDMGINPEGWSALNVTQMGIKFPLVFSDQGRNATGKSIKMMNRKLGAFGIGANSPSYVTLGNTWVYADIVGVSWAIKPIQTTATEVRWAESSLASVPIRLPATSRGSTENRTPTR